MKAPRERSDFHDLTPQRVLDLVEQTLGTPTSNICHPLTSYINRVYEVRLECGASVVVKFYRPGRWKPDGLREEHRFVRSCADAEIPVVAPLPDEQGETLHCGGGQTWYALYPRLGGRAFEDPAAETWTELGRLLARLHNVGALEPTRERPILHPEQATLDHLDEIFACPTLPEHLGDQYEDLAAELLDEISPMFDGVPLHRIHGDCHPANLLHRPGEHYLLIDFDDMCLGPAVQDVWMLLPGYREDVDPELHHFMEGYRQFRDFEPGWLALIEPLRAMRYIHFAAWCVRQRRDHGYQRLSEDFGTDTWWAREIDDLRRQLERIRVQRQGGVRYRPEE